MYLDEILVYNQTKEENMRHLKLVLSTMQQEKLLTNLKKWNFMKNKFVYSGFVILEDGLNMDSNKRWKRKLIGWFQETCLR